MPKVLEVKGFKFKFYSNENLEPVHIHVVKAGGHAKYWLGNDIIEAFSYGFSQKEKKLIRAIINENYFLLKGKWNEHFNQ